MMLSTRGRNDGCEPHHAIEKSLMMYWSSCGGIQAVFLWELRVAVVLGLGYEGGEGREEEGGGVTTERCLFPFIYYDPHA